MLQCIHANEIVKRIQNRNSVFSRLKFEIFDNVNTRPNKISSLLFSQV